MLYDKESISQADQDTVATQPDVPLTWNVRLGTC